MGKVLRFIGILLMGLTAAFTILGGVGTTCVALAAEKYDSMLAIVPYKWLYVLFVVVTTAIGVMGVRAVVLQAKGRKNAYRYSMIALVSGIVVGGIHMAVSRALRGSSMPVDGVVYTTVLTLIVFLVFRIPSVWEKVNFDKAMREGDNNGPSAAAIVLMLSGLQTLTVQYWVGSTHIMNGGINYADAWHPAMSAFGWGLVLIGAGWMVRIFAVSYQLVWSSKEKAYFEGGTSTAASIH